MFGIENVWFRDSLPQMHLVGRSHLNNETINNKGSRHHSESISRETDWSLVISLKIVFKQLVGSVLVKKLGSVINDNLSWEKSGSGSWIQLSGHYQLTETVDTIKDLYSALFSQKAPVPSKMKNGQMSNVGFITSVDIGTFVPKLETIQSSH